MKAVTIELPDDLAKTVDSLGLLDQGAVISVFENAVERHEAIEHFFADLDALSALDTPEMSLDEIQKIISEVRASRRADRS